MCVAYFYAQFIRIRVNCKLVTSQGSHNLLVRIQIPIIMEIILCELIYKIDHILSFGISIIHSLGHN